MGRSCIVCGARQTKTSPLSFHRFPKDEKKCSKWLEACKLNKSSIKEDTLLCSKHFKEDNYEHQGPARRRLHSSAVPTPVIKKQKSSQKTSQKALVDQIMKADMNQNTPDDEDSDSEHFSTSKVRRHYLDFMRTTIEEHRKMIKVLRSQTKSLLLRHESIKNHLRDLKLLPEEATASMSV